MLAFKEEVFEDRLTALCAIKQVQQCVVTWLPSGSVRVSGYWDCFHIQEESQTTDTQQLKAEIALLLNTWDNTTKQQFLDTWVLRIKRLRQLSAV